MRYALVIILLHEVELLMKDLDEQINKLSKKGE